MATELILIFIVIGKIISISASPSTGRIKGEESATTASNSDLPPTMGFESKTAAPSGSPTASSSHLPPTMGFIPKTDAPSAGWNLSTPYSSNRHVCVLVRTYQGNSVLSILTLVSSLLRSAENADATLTILFANTDPKNDFALLPSIIKKINVMFSLANSGPTSILISPRKHRDLKQHFPKFNGNDYGYIVTDFAMNDLLNQGCQKLLVTNGDNVYSREFFKNILDAMNKGAQMVITRFVSRYNLSHEHLMHLQSAIQCGTFRFGPNQVFFPKPKQLCIDLGAVVTSAQAIRDSGARFIISDILRDPAEWSTHFHEFVFFSRNLSEKC